MKSIAKSMIACVSLFVVYLVVVEAVCWINCPSEFRDSLEPFCYLNDDGSSSICRIIVNTSNLIGLTEQDLNKIKLVINATDRINTVEILSWLSDYQLEINAYRQFHQITSFRTSGNNHIVSVSLLSSLPNLVKFRMFNGNFYHFPIFSLFNKQLTYLSLNSFGFRSNVRVIRGHFVSELPNLKYLYIYSRNKLVINENIFSGLTALTYLVTSRFQFRNTVSTLSPLVRLKGLGIRRAEISDIEFLKLTPSLYQLYYLNFKYNLISSFPSDIFSDYTQLKKLDLRSNLITVINRTSFTKFGNVEYLYISSNQITAVPEDTFRDMPQLRTVFLDNNQITTLSSRVFEHLPHINYVSLLNNPFHCDCSIEWISVLPQKYGIHFNYPTCNTPPEQEGISITTSSLYTNCTRELSYQCFNKSVICPRGSYCRDTLYSYECVCEGEGVAFSSSLNSCIDYEKLIQIAKPFCEEFVMDPNGHANCIQSTSIVTTTTPTCPVQTCPVQTCPVQTCPVQTCPVQTTTECPTTNQITVTEADKTITTRIPPI